MFKREKCSFNGDLSFIWKLQYFILHFLIFITAIKLKNGACVIPEASQEGALHTFKDFEDVVMLHYNVPKQVLRATWQFAAFMDDENCPHRKVNIFLKWGSYPVISVNNATYPPNMYVENNNTVEVATLTNFEPKSMTIVPVYSPEPGDWFVGAYLSYLDEKVHQKGLGHKCRYSLGSVAIWTETTDIQNIPLGYQETIKTSETISYYKIYIPMNTWSFQVDIWGCNFTFKVIKNFKEPCIKDIILKERVLPFYNHSKPSSSGNLTSMDVYTFTESSPFQDTWYYLMVVSSSAINFNIKITVFDCPIRSMNKAFILQNGNVPLPFSIIDQLRLRDSKAQTLQWYTFNQNPISQPNEELNNTNICFPRYQLVRIKYTQAFSADYLLQGKDWLTSWLTLTDVYPVVIQFDILPLVDIGGTLDINMHLEINKNLIKQQVNIIICVSRGRIPKQEAGNIICDNLHMMMQLSSNDTRNASLLIPYPQPDIWYIAFQATCYVNEMPVHCEMEEILVSLSIKLRACVFEGSHSCGQYGVCQEISKGILYYTACKCFAGRQGWGCTDTSKALSEVSILLKTLFLILSNLFFIPAIYIAFKRRFYVEGLVYISTMLFSAFYHACDQQFATYCITKYEVLQYCDFFSGILAFWITLISMADVPVQYLSFCHMLGVIIITFAVESDKTSLISILVPLLIGVLISLSTYGYDCFKTKTFVKPRRMKKLIFGLLLAGFGILLYTLVETDSNYEYIHSIWHIIIALSLIFLLPPINENQNSSNESDNELLNCTESPDSSVFNIENAQRNSHLIADIS